MIRKKYSAALAAVLALILLLAACTTPLLPSDTGTEGPTGSEGAEPGGTDTPATETERETGADLPAEESTIPVISIDTDDGQAITSRTKYKNATLTVSGASYVHYNITIDTQIRGRGNSSFDGKADQEDYNSKNSYRLKLGTKTNLLGVGDTADRDWVLISGKFDASALRNYLVWHLGEQMGTIPYVPSCTWVNLYVNGDYRGLYTLCEKIEVASDRVNIDESASTDPNKVGYLVEYDLRGAYDSGAKQDLTYFYIPGLDETFAWVVKSEVYGEEETAAIRSHLIACNEAILSGDRARMEALVDMASFVDMFILQELSKNPDAGCSSFFMQRDAGGKLCLTAPWDFDFALGTYSVSQTTTGLMADGEKPMSHPWFEFLVTQPWFMKLVYERLQAIEPLVENTVAEIRGMTAKLKAASDANDERWNIYGEKFSIYPADQVSVKLNSYEEHVEFLAEWVEKRYTNLLKEVKKLTK